MIDNDTITYFGQLVFEAEWDTINAIKDGRIQTEDGITGRFTTKLEEIINKRGKKGNIVFEVRIMGDKGLGAAEKKYGADFCGVLHVSLPNYEESKGFLFQAKREGRVASFPALGNPLSATVNLSEGDERRKLNEQAKNMLSITHASFVIVYSVKGFLVVPASAVGALKGPGILPGKPVRTFFVDYLKCFIGDAELKAYSDSSLEDLRKKTNAKVAALFQIHGSSDHTLQ